MHSILTLRSAAIALALIASAACSSKKDAATDTSAPSGADGLAAQVAQTDSAVANLSGRWLGDNGQTLTLQHTRTVDGEDRFAASLTPLPDHKPISMWAPSENDGRLELELSALYDNPNNSLIFQVMSVGPTSLTLSRDGKTIHFTRTR